MQTDSAQLLQTTTPRTVKGVHHFVADVGADSTMLNRLSLEARATGVSRRRETLDVATAERYGWLSLAAIASGVGTQVIRTFREADVSQFLHLPLPQAEKQTFDLFPGQNLRVTFTADSNGRDIAVAALLAASGRSSVWYAGTQVAAPIFHAHLQEAIRSAAV